MKHARDDYNRIQDPESKIPMDEPVFLLRAQDILAEPLLRNYANAARILGQHELAQKALDHADRMRDWPTKKVPDL